MGGLLGYRFHKAVCSVLLVLVTAIVVTGCSPRPEEVEAVTESVLRVGMWSSPKIFNPLATTDGYSCQVMSLIFPMLISFDEELKPAPYLAERWEVSEDGLTWTFYLNPAAKWTDGELVTAKDIEFSVMLWANKEIGSMYLGNVPNIIGIEEYQAGATEDVTGIEVLDDKTISFTLTAPSGCFLNAMYYYILPEHVLKDIQPKDLGNAEFFFNPTVGAGPFKFVQYVTDQYVELEKNPDFVLGAPKIDKLILNIGNQDTILAQLEKGEVDIAAVAPLEVNRIQEKAGLSVVFAGGSTQVLHVNLQKSYLQDKRVRKAMMMAMDRQGFVDSFYHGNAEVANAPQFPDWAANENLYDYPYDPNQARMLLEEADWDFSQEIIIRVPTGDKPREDMGSAIQAQLEAVGVKARIELSDFATLTSYLKSGDYDLGFLGWGGGRDPHQSATVYSSKYFPPAGWNVSFYKNERVDELFEKGLKAVDLDERALIYKEIHAILNDELPGLFTVTPYQAFAYSEKVHGIKAVSGIGWGNLDSILWNVHELTLSK